MNIMLLPRCLALVVFVAGSAMGWGAEEQPDRDWIRTGAIDAPEAVQAAAAEGAFVYAVANKVIARYERSTGRRVAVSTGEAHHLNSGFIHEGKLYAAHSNFPQKPEKSEIKVLDLETMMLTDFQSFGDSPHGSLTVALFHDKAWWCVFARYGEENERTALVKYDTNWNEQRVWTFPKSVVSDLGDMSISGGIWREGELWATGHDHEVIYRLQLPETGNTLIHRGTVKTPFPGQGIAADPQTGGLIGIHRPERRIVFAKQK